MIKSNDASISQHAASTTTYDVVVMGAGPYGLSTAAHLQGCGLEVAVFGKPLQLWREHMPKGMLLRSFWWATSFSDPNRKYGIAQYFQATNQKPIDPLPAEIVIDYGIWFQKHIVPQTDETYVQTIERKEDQFEVTLADGRVIHSLAVVMAPGLYYYTYRPIEYDHFPSELVSHSSVHSSFENFAGKQIVIIGGGQSALETAALAHESGANVHVVSRRPVVWIRGNPSFPEHRPFIKRLVRPKAGIAPGWFNWNLEHFPYLFQKLPRTIREQILRGPGSYGPMGAPWLKPRVIGKVHLYESQRVEQAKEADDSVMLKLSNNEVLKADHVILATGYRIDINKLPMLHSSLVSEIQTFNNAPVLNNRFESSVPGLYFIGFSSVPSSGPFYRFVVGTEAAAQRTANSIARRAQQMRKL